MFSKVLIGMTFVTGTSKGWMAEPLRGLHNHSERNLLIIAFSVSGATGFTVSTAGSKLISETDDILEARNQ